MLLELQGDELGAFSEHTLKLLDRASCKEPRSLLHGGGDLLIPQLLQVCPPWEQVGTFTCSCQAWAGWTFVFIL